MGQKKNVDMSTSETKIKVVKATTEAVETQTEKKTAKPTPKKKLRSQKYQAVRSQVDKTKLYDPFSTIELIKKLSYSSFPGTIVVHIVLAERFQGERVELQFPHSTGKSITVAIADAKLLTDIKAGKIKFEILLATPDMMPKLAKLAKILGPKGLMPNPKQGTLIADPKTKKKELESGKITIRSERKAPLMHIIIGNTSMETKELVENLQTLLDVLKDKMIKVSLAATMSPGVKVSLDS
jgi:large subunit ribosomal protein L1